MRYLQDISLLLIYGLFFLFYSEINFIFVLAFLCAMILGCCGYFINSPWPRIVLSLFYMAAAFMFPAFFFFYPVPVYLLLRDDLKIPGLLGIFFDGYHFLTTGKAFGPPLILGLFSCLLTVLLQYRTKQDELLNRQFCQLRDDNTEENLLLTEKNKNLLEKQDYEIYTATLKERNRIAREIHDNVGHVLSRSILIVGAAKAINESPSMSSLLEDLDTSLNSAMDSIRNSVHDLHDESINLKEAVQNLINDFTFCPVDLDYDMGLEIPRQIKYCFISITKESLSNIMRHSNADRVQILMREHPALYQLRIQDNGDTSALRMSQIPDSDPGIGIQNMKERVQFLSGTMQIDVVNGFKIFISIPKE